MIYLIWLERPDKKLRFLLTKGEKTIMDFDVGRRDCVKFNESDILMQYKMNSKKVNGSKYVNWYWLRGFPNEYYVAVYFHPFNMKARAASMIKIVFESKKFEELMEGHRS